MSCVCWSSISFAAVCHDVRLVLELLRDEVVRLVERDGREDDERHDRDANCPADQRAKQARREELSEEGHRLG